MSAQSSEIARIAVGINGYPEGRDAAVLGAAIARESGAEGLLIAIHPDPLVVLPSDLGWSGMHDQAVAVLRETRDAVWPEARIDVETDWSVPRALERVVAREHRDLLILGSSRRGPEGQVRIGTRTRQLLCHCTCALAVVPRGFGEAGGRRLATIGVGYDGSAEGRAALSLAAAIARATGAGLRVRAVMDDRLPVAGWLESGRERVRAMWDSVLVPQVETLREDARQAASEAGAPMDVEAFSASPPDALLELSEHVDLLVIGSRRWGATARVLLGSTGERLMHESRSAVLVAPRPPA